MAQDLDEGSEGVKASPIEEPTPEESSQPEVGGSGVAPLTMTDPHRERVLETTHEILACVHALCPQTMHEMGGVWELNSSSNSPH